MKKYNTILRIFAVCAVLIGTFLIVANGFNLTDIKTSSDMTVSIPEPTSYLIDEVGVIPSNKVDSLKRLLTVTDGSNDIQVGILIVKTTKPLSIEEYGIRVGEKWKVGSEEFDDGAIIIIATEDRKVRLEIGYGLESDITDSTAGYIIDEYMIPFLVQNDYAQAVEMGIKAIQAYNTIHK